MKRVYYGLLAVFLALALCVSPGWAETYYVVPSGTVNDGYYPNIKYATGSWNAASSSTETNQTFSDLMTALNNGGTAYIQGGQYSVTTNNETYSLVLPAGAKLYGGFAGTETENEIASLIKEDIRTLSKETIILGADAKHLFNCKNDSNAGETRIDGVTLTHKTTNVGRALRFENADATLANCTFKDNTLSAKASGAGVMYYVNNGSHTLNVINCNFESNTGTGTYGGGLRPWATGSGVTLNVNVKNSTFSKNTALGGPGGGIAHIGDEGANIISTVENCTFDSNEAGTGGGLDFELFGTSKGTLKVTNCLFTGNKAENTSDSTWGGGISIIANEETTFSTDSIIESCTFTGNKSKNGAGIMSIIFKENAPLKVQNCTFTGNEASVSPYKGAGFYNNGGEAVLTNCTFVNNTTSDTSNTVGGVDIYNEDYYRSSENSYTIAKTKVVNSIIYNTLANSIKNDTTRIDSTVTLALTYCAYKDNAFTSGATSITADDTNKTITTLSSTTAKEKAVDGVTHKVFMLTADDKDLIRGGTKDDAPETDQLGYIRDTSNPSIGAVEYIGSLTVNSEATLPEGTVGVEYSAELEADYDTPQTGATFKWEEVTSGDALSGFGLKVSSDQVAGTPTKAGTYYFTLKATGSGDLYSTYTAQKDFTLKINAAPVVVTKSSPDIGTVSITVKNAVGSNTAAFSVTSGDITLTTSNDLTSSVKVNGTAYKLASSDATPVFSVNAGNATLKAAYMGDANSDWSSTSDLDDLTITNLTAISGQEAISETSPDYYRFQFNVSDDYYFTLELSVLLSGEPEAKVTSDEVTSGSVSEPTETFTIGDETYYRVPANGSDNLVTKNVSGVWQLPRVISFAIMGGFNNFISMMRGIERTIAQIVTGIFQPNADGLFTNIGAALSKPVHPGTIFIIRLAPSGWRLPFMTGFERGAMRVAKVEDGAIIGAMTVQNTAGNSNINEEIKTLHIDTSDLRDPDDSTKKVPVPEGAYAISYSTLNGEVYGAFSDDIKVAAANYTPSNGDDDTDTNDEQETSSHGGSSGCNAGFGLFALAALALAYKKFSK